jgi:TonB family protein
MKTLTRITLAALFCATAGAAARGQDAWVEVSPAGEGFVALMPKQPASQPAQARADDLQLSGRRYAATGDDQTTYIVWSLKDPAGGDARMSAQAYVTMQTRDGGLSYLDEVADVAWELLITPELERLKSKNAPPQRFAGVGMAYRRELELYGRPAREYSAGLENSSGVVYVCADGARVYVVAALGAEEKVRQFVGSFSFGKGGRGRGPTPLTIDVDPALTKPDSRDTTYGTPKSPAPSSGPGTGGGIGTGSGIGAGEGGGVGPGRGGNVGGGDARQGDAASGGPVDYNRPFMMREVTKKALITYKPEPAFTESARKFQVTGVVRLRAILAATGEVKGIAVVKWLPHGLTWKAVDAARRIRFEPAQKDGHVVSQYVTLEYNFNIY